MTSPAPDPAPAMPHSTPLADILTRRIRADGPISVAEYMADCLLHPQHGYYATRDPFGQAGDFTTAPEISQMYGELMGLALAQSWLDQGAPAPFTLAEPGPGRGTLMADILRATARVPGFHAAARPHLIEASPTLRRIQAQTLAPFAATCAAPVWHDTIDTLPDQPLFLIANEFFDALPIRQFIRADHGGWHERVIGLGTPDTPTGTAPDTALCFGLTPPAPRPDLTHRLQGTRPGDLVELCPALPGIVAAIATRIARHGGVALIVDYGDNVSLGDTLQALRAHAPDDPLAHPGWADLTAHVDFDAIRRAATTPPAPETAAKRPPPAAGALKEPAAGVFAQPAAGAPNAPPANSIPQHAIAHPEPRIRVTPLTPQGVLLERLGITERARALAQNLSGAALDSHIRAHRRLTHPAEMGNLFKAVALYPHTAPQPPGFTA